MKLSIFASVSAAALLAATGAFAAGSTSTVNQSGLSQQATIDQVGASGGLSTISQIGADNWANVKQGNGAANTATINQNGADMAPVGVPQTDGLYSQKLSNIADVTQNGSGGQGTINQTGNNRGTIYQAYAPGSTQTATINQYGGTAGENYSGITQRGVNILATTEQNGQANWNSQSQQSVANSTSVVRQIGNDNLSTANQGHENDVIGSGNSSEIYQLTNGAIAHLDQHGSNNWSQINQNWGGIANVDQDGNGNVSLVTQNDNATASVEQDGNENRSNISQTSGSAGATATVKQTSTSGLGGYPSNNSDIVQSADATASVTQNGDNNYSTVNQSATGSLATINQDGSNLFSSVNQTGLMSDADVTQTGSNNQSFVTQGGDHNSASVTQANNGNTSNVIQSGAFGVATISQ